MKVKTKLVGSVLCAVVCELLSVSAYADIFASLDAVKINGGFSSSLVRISDNFLNRNNAVFVNDPLKDGWIVDVEKEYVLIPDDGLIIPVQLPSIVLAHDTRGVFSVVENRMRSATRTPVVVVNPPDTTQYNVRPTLFITLPGGALEPGISPWQNDVQGVLVNFENNNNARHSQYLHFQVDWESDKPMRNQVQDLARTVKHFLSGRAYPWDVVIVGFSRGGIFAHELSQELVGHANIDDLHTFLLDPTAAINGDQYPKVKARKEPTRTFASLFYDGALFTLIEDQVYSPILYGMGSQGDLPIPGYDNYGRGQADHLLDSTHTEFADDWLADTNRGLERALGDIWRNKDTGAYLQDGHGGFEIVTVREKDLDFDADVRVEGDTVYINGALIVGHAEVSIDSMIGKEGVELSATLLVATAQASIRDDQASISSNTILHDFAVSISLHDGSYARVNMLVAESGIQIGSGRISFSSSLLGKDVFSSNFSSHGSRIRVGGKTIIKI